MIKILLYMFLTMWISAMIPFVHAAILDNKLEYIDELVKRGADIDKNMGKRR